MKGCACARCGYEWKSRVEAPKECPRCKARLDAPPAKAKEEAK